MNDEYDQEYGGGGNNAPLARVANNGGMMQATQGLDGSRQMAQVSAHAYSLAQTTNSQMQNAIMVAKQFPRDPFEFRREILTLCKTPEFAEIARYAKPQGWLKDEKGKENGKRVRNFVRGWSVKFTDPAIAMMGNIGKIDKLIDDTPHGLLFQVGYVDYQKNNWYTQEVLVPKTVERSYLAEGQFALDQRINNYGKPVFIVPATADEIKLTAANLRAKARRDEALRLLPSHVLAEAQRIVEETVRQDAKDNPIAARKRLVDAFDQIGVKPSDLVEYLGGRDLDALTPDMIVELRALFTMIKEDGVRWRDVLSASPHVDRQETGEEAPESNSPAAKIRAQLDKRTQEIGDKDKAAAARKALVEGIAKAVGVDIKAVQTVLQQVNAGKDAANIARYSREQTGIEDEVIVSEIISRATAAGLIKPKQEPKTETRPEEKAPETPKTAPVPPAAETKPDVGKGKRSGGKADPKFTAIAQAEGVPVEIVVELAKYASGDDPDSTIVGVLKLAGYNVDEPTVGIVRAALRK